jgi:hypothetical protein
MSEADHKTVARVLEQLRAAGDPAVEIDVRHFTIPDRALDDAARAMLLAPGQLEAEQIAALARLDIRGGRQGGTLQVPLGRWGVYRDTRQLRYVPDRRRAQGPGTRPRRRPRRSQGRDRRSSFATEGSSCAWCRRWETARSPGAS